MANRWRWRWFGGDLADIVAATFMASLGTAAPALYALRRARHRRDLARVRGLRDLYGVRLAASTAAVPLALGGRPGSRAYGRATLFGDRRFHAVIADRGRIGRRIWRGRSSPGTG
jgi:hypothetical protein